MAPAALVFISTLFGRQSGESLADETVEATPQDAGLTPSLQTGKKSEPPSEEIESSAGSDNSTSDQANASPPLPTSSVDSDSGRDEQSSAAGPFPATFSVPQTTTTIDDISSIPNKVPAIASGDVSLSSTLPFPGVESTTTALQAESSTADSITDAPTLVNSSEIVQTTTSSVISDTSSVTPTNFPIIAVPPASDDTKPLATSSSSNTRGTRPVTFTGDAPLATTQAQTFIPADPSSTTVTDSTTSSSSIVLSVTDAPSDPNLSTSVLTQSSDESLATTTATSEAVFSSSLPAATTATIVADSSTNPLLTSSTILITVVPPNSVTEVPAASASISTDLDIQPSVSAIDGNISAPSAAPSDAGDSSSLPLSSVPSLPPSTSVDALLPPSVTTTGTNDAIGGLRTSVPTGIANLAAESTTDGESPVPRTFTVPITIDSSGIETTSTFTLTTAVPASASSLSIAVTLTAPDSNGSPIVIVQSTSLPINPSQAGSHVSKSSSTRMILGTVSGIIGAIIIIALLVVFFIRRRKRLLVLEAMRISVLQPAWDDDPRPNMLETGRRLHGTGRVSDAPTLDTDPFKAASVTLPQRQLQPFSVVPSANPFEDTAAVSLPPTHSAPRIEVVGNTDSWFNPFNDPPLPPPAIPSVMPRPKITVTTPDGAERSQTSSLVSSSSSEYSPDDARGFRLMASANMAAGYRSPPTAALAM